MGGVPVELPLCLTLSKFTVRRLQLDSRALRVEGLSRVKGLKQGPLQGTLGVTWGGVLEATWLNRKYK